jgi:hypothetical protein
MHGSIAVRLLFGVFILLFPYLAGATGNVPDKPPAVGDKHPLYSVAKIDFEIDRNRKVGRKKAGLACLPAGGLRWRDVSQPKDSDLISAVSTALIKTGQDVAMPIDDVFRLAPIKTPYLIAGIIKDVSLNVCMPKWGVFGTGNKDWLKGAGALTVEWTIYSYAKKSAIQTITIEQPFEIAPSDNGGFAEVIRAALVANAKAFGSNTKFAVD